MEWLPRRLFRRCGGPEPPPPSGAGASNLGVFRGASGGASMKATMHVMSSVRSSRFIHRL